MNNSEIVTLEGPNGLVIHWISTYRNISLYFMRCGHFCGTASKHEGRCCGCALSGDDPCGICEISVPKTGHINITDYTEAIRAYDEALARRRAEENDSQRRGLWM